MLQWSQIDTVLVDMDGTLIDLHYDNTLWNQRLPEQYGAMHELDVEHARTHLFQHMADTRASLDFYCLDYWSTFTRLDIDGLHFELAHLIAFRNNAQTFLRRIRQSGRRVVLVTNAHPRSLAVKDQQTGLTELLDADHSSHHFGAPKEHATFWPALAAAEPFEPSRTLMIDDNVNVLDAARDHGIEHLLCVLQPDSQRPVRSDLPYPAFNDFAEIMPPSGQQRRQRRR